MRQRAASHIRLAAFQKPAATSSNSPADCLPTERQTERKKKRESERERERERERGRGTHRLTIDVNLYHLVLQCTVVLKQICTE